MDRDILRGLAAQIAEIAALDVQEENRRLHRGVDCAIRRPPHFLSRRAGRAIMR